MLRELTRHDLPFVLPTRRLRLIILHRHPSLFLPDRPNLHRRGAHHIDIDSFEPAVFPLPDFCGHPRRGRWFAERPVNSRQPPLAMSIR